jgi:hypothetical protein
LSRLLALVIFFILFVLLASANENSSLENGNLSLGNKSIPDEQNASISQNTTNLEESAIIDSGIIDPKTVSVESADVVQNGASPKTTESSEIQPQLEENKNKAVSASFGVYLNIAG